MSGNWKVQHSVAQDCSCQKNPPISSLFFFIFSSSPLHFHLLLSYPSLSFKTAPFFSLLFIQIHHPFSLPVFSCTCLNSLLKTCISLLQFYDAAVTIFFSYILLKPENGLLQKVLFSITFLMALPLEFVAIADLEHILVNGILQK